MYDYTIIGAGAAGLQLALAMNEDTFFSTKKILLLDKEKKNQNDKTWCYWEKGKGKWDHLVLNSWKSGLFYNNDKAIQLNLLPYHYKMLKSIDFYRYAREELGSNKNITWLHENVIEVLADQEKATIQTDKNDYTSTCCFDSRIPAAYYKDQNKYIKILQHFKGVTIQFSEDLFDPDQFTMMDFRLQHNDSTSFMYILPTSKNEALFEFTLFTKQVLEEKEYDKYISTYINKYVTKSSEYKITDTEQGVIPMTNFPFHQYSEKTNIKIGAAGSWIRPSTGYSFKNASRYVNLIIDNIKKNRTPNHHLIKKKYRFYDTLLLDILSRKNHSGPGIFEQMYSNNNIHAILGFLDGKTSLFQDFKILSSFDSKPFIVSIINQINKIRIK